MSKSASYDHGKWGFLLDDKEVQKRKRLFARLGIDPEQSSRDAWLKQSVRSTGVPAMSGDTYPHYTAPPDAFGPPLAGVRWCCPCCGEYWPAFWQNGSSRLTRALECRDDGCALCRPQYRRRKNQKMPNVDFFAPEEGIPALRRGEFAVIYKFEDRPALGRVVRDGAVAKHIARTISGGRPRNGVEVCFRLSPATLAWVKCVDHEGATVGWKEALAAFDWPSDDPPKKRKLYLKLPNTARSEDGLDIINPPGKAAFEELYDRLKGPRVVTLFHGTYQAYLTDIVKQGLRCGKGGAFGSGIYFGLLPKAAGFAKDGHAGDPREWATTADRWLRNQLSLPRQKIPKNEKRKRRTLAKREERYVIEADVILGESWHAHSPEAAPERNNKYFAREMARRGCLSVFYDGFKNPEWVVYSRSQVLIKRVLEVTRVHED